MEKWHLVNSSEVLGFLSFAGLVTCLWRLRTSDHPGHLIAFALMLLGTLVREIAVYLYGAEVWGPAALFLSAIARDIQILGALLFVRAVTLPRCGEWIWIGVGAASLLFAGVMP